MLKLTNKSPAEFRPPNIKLGYALLMIVSTSSPNVCKAMLAAWLLKFIIYLFERLTTIYNIEKFVIANNNIGILLHIKSVDISLSIKSRENAWSNFV